jgi:hypothetical protein
VIACNGAGGARSEANAGKQVVPLQIRRIFEPIIMSLSTVLFSITSTTTLAIVKQWSRNLPLPMYPVIAQFLAVEAAPTRCKQTQRRNGIVQLFTNRDSNQEHTPES